MGVAVGKFLDPVYLTSLLECHTEVNVERVGIGRLVEVGVLDIATGVDSVLGDVDPLLQEVWV